MYAPYGPLPLHITEHALVEKRFARNPGFEDFINVVCGDLAWVHYVAWSAMHPVLGTERVRDPFAERITSLANFRLPAANEDPSYRHALSCRHSYPGLYSSPTRSLAGLQGMLNRYFDVAFHVKPRHGRWIPVPNTGSHTRTLGRWRLGRRAWDAQMSIEVVIGPIDADKFHQWQRGADAVRAVAAVLTDFTYGRIQPVVRVQVRTRPDLAGRVGRMRLGVDAWSCPDHSLQTITMHESFRDPL